MDNKNSFFVGYFVFQNIGDGCLVAKYSNTDIEKPLTECAKRIRTEPGSNSDNFAGEYVSTWIEDETAGNPDNQTDMAMLKISSISRKFLGQGMLFNGLLTGAYWKPQLAGI